MADLGKMNAIASDYQKRIKDPDWRIGKQKDLEDFSKGAQESGNEEMKQFGSGLKKRLQGAWKALTE